MSSGPRTTPGLRVLGALVLALGALVHLEGVARSEATCALEDGELTLETATDLTVSRDADGLILADHEPLTGACEGATVETVSSIALRAQGRLAIELANGGLRKADGTTIPVALSLTGDADVLAVVGTEEAEVIVVGADAADLLGAGAPNVTGLESVEGLELRLGAGDDEASLRGGGDLGAPWDRPSDLDGEEGDDLLQGGDGPDVLGGGAGDDALLGRGGEDRFDGGTAFDGNDVLNGGPGRDTADYAARSSDLRLHAQLRPSGEAGEADQLVGIEVLAGGSGDDALVGAGMNEVLIGGPGDDRLEGSSGRDELRGDDGADVLIGGREPDVLLGGAGRDTLRGGGGGDALRGGPANDELDGGPNGDVLAGGPGRDVATFARSPAAVRVDLADGTAEGAGTGRDRLRAIEDVRGSAAADILLGDPRPNRLEGGRGEDILGGRAGDDLLDGGQGWDRGDGGPGADRCRRMEEAISCVPTRSLGIAADQGPLERLLDPRLAWNTFLGGPGEDYPAAVEKVPTGGTYVVGTSAAPWGSPLRSFEGGGTDAFVARLDAGGRVLWSTFLGGAGQDVASDVAVLADGTVVVAGWSGATWGTPVREHRGSADGFIAFLDPTGALRTLTFVGGSGRDRLAAIAPSPEGTSVVAVGTSSRSWGNPLAPFSGGTDTLVAALGPGGGLRWSTFLGGSGDDGGAAVATSGDTIVVAGHASAGFGSPVRPFAGGARDALLAALEPGGALRWTTFLGGAGTDEATTLALRDDGTILAAGWSSAPWGDPARAFSGRSDGFLAEVSADGGLARSTFLGGSGWDRVDAVGVDPSGNAFAVGRSTASWGTPRRAYAGGEDAFLASVDGAGGVPWLSFLGGAGNDVGADLAFATQAVVVTGMSDASWGDPVRPFRGGWTDVFAASVPIRAADLAVSQRVRGPYLGRGISGDGQTLRASALVGDTATFYVRAWNEGALVDRIRFAGCSSSEGFGVRYFRGSTDVTASVVDGTLLSAPLPTGAHAQLRVEILVKRTARVGDTESCRITGSSAAAGRMRDTVRVTVKVVSD